RRTGNPVRGYLHALELAALARHRDQFDELRMQRRLADAMQGHEAGDGPAVENAAEQPEIHVLVYPGAMVDAHGPRTARAFEIAQGGDLDRQLLQFGRGRENIHLSAPSCPHSAALLPRLAQKTPRLHPFSEA